MKPDYKELIERLEKATVPDRDLDLAIHAALINEPVESLRALESLGGTPAFTSSIDAALTLVSEDWVVFEMGETSRPSSAWHVVLMTSAPKTEGEAHGHHKIPAIALCIAALRARSA